MEQYTLLKNYINKRPFLAFGAPFVIFMITASFALTNVTQMRYDEQEKKVRKMTKLEISKMSAGKKAFDMEKEYEVTSTSFHQSP